MRTTPEDAWIGATSPLANAPTLPLRTLVPDHARLVVLAPHPDDETLMAGGMLAALPPGRALVVAATDGEASHAGTAAFQRRLAERRRREQIEALAVLGHSRAALHRLRLRDGSLARFEVSMADELRRIVRDHDVLLTTPSFDGHPDHEACARAAARVRTATGCALWFAPVWAWHWRTPEDALPFERFRKIPVTRMQRRAKASATQCFRSQIDRTDIEAIVPPDVLAHFDRPFETVIAHD